MPQTVYLPVCRREIVSNPPRSVRRPAILSDLRLDASSTAALRHSAQPQPAPPRPTAQSATITNHSIRCRREFSTSLQRTGLHVSCDRFRTHLLGESHDLASGNVPHRAAASSLLPSLLRPA